MVVSSTPKPHSSSIAAIKKFVSDASKGPSKQTKDSIFSTPHRGYSYKVTSTPLSKSNTRSMQLSTPSVNKWVDYHCLKIDLMSFTQTEPREYAATVN